MRMRRVTYGKVLLCHAALCVMIAFVVGTLSPLVVGATSSADAGPASYVSVASEVSLSSRSEHSELNVAAGAESSSSSSSSSSSFVMPSSSAESSGDGSMPSSASSLSHEESGRSSESSESEKAVSESATSSSSASSLPNELSSDTSGNSESSTSSSELSSASSESRAESLPSSSSSSSFFPSSEEAESVSSSSSSGSEQKESLSSSSSSVASLSLSSESMSEHNASSSASSSSLPLSPSLSSSSLSSEAVGGSSSSESSSSGSNASTTSSSTNSSSSDNPSPVVPGVSGSVLITLVYDQRQVATGDVLGYVGDTLSSTYGVAGEVTRLMDDMDARETFWSLGGDGAANSRSRSTQAAVAAAVTDTAATKPGDFGEAGSYFRTFLNVSGVEETTAQAFLSDVNRGKYQPRLLVASTWSVAELPVNKAWIAGIVVAAVVSVVAIVLVLVRFLPGCCKDRDARKQDEAYHSLNSYFDLEMQYTNHNNIAYETRPTGPSEPQQQWPVLLGREDSAGRLKPVAVAR